MRALSLYGVMRNRPKWWIRTRGFNWLRSGFCPCCYSSPPLPECPVCEGWYPYGSELPEQVRSRWFHLWLNRTDS